MSNNNVLGQYYVGGRLIISHDNTNALKGVIINTNPIDYESLLTSDDKWHSMSKSELQETLENLKSKSEEKLEEERKEKLDKLYNTIREYKSRYNAGKETTYNDEEAVRYLQVEFPKFSSNNKQMIYNKHIDSDEKHKDFSTYFIESDVDLDEIKKILFDNENQ